MPAYDLIEYSDNYGKISGSLWQYHKDDPNDNIIDSESFNFKARITRTAPADGNTKDVEIVIPLKYVNNFWRTLKMPSINCEISLQLTWSASCVITNSTGAGTGTKLYVPVKISSTLDNAKLLEQLKIGSKQTIDWSKYDSELRTYERQNSYLNHLVNPSFQEVNRLFVLLFENEAGRAGRTEFYRPKVFD